MEQTIFEPGVSVEVEAAGGELITRRVVALERGRVFVCTDQEYEAASKDGREPVCVGFRPESVHVRA